VHPVSCELISSRSPARAHFQLAGLGIVAGLIAAFFLSHFLSSILFGITTHDIVTFVTVPLCLIVIALLAGYFPARRATRVDPVTSLRYE
jgi:ABC-type antimicrobial peptide transport system permease subunit